MRNTLLLLMIPCTSFSQIDTNQSLNEIYQNTANETVNLQSKTNFIINDSSLIKEVIPKTTFVRKEITYCCHDNIFIDGHETLHAGDSVIISGIASCKACYSYPDSYSDFYEIIYKRKTYYIAKDELMSNDDYYSQIEKMSLHSSENFKRNAQLSANKEYNNKIFSLKQQINSYKPKGLVILDWYKYDESEYTNGTNLTFNVYNPTNKIIKYIWVSVIGYNPVNDIVVDRIKKKSAITVKAVGPIKPKESANYDFDYVWYSDLIETVKISQIKVLYMDGSEITIQNAKSIMPKISFEDLNLLKESEL